MKPFPIEIGRVVCSKAGRDAGRALVVLAVEDERYVRVADGRLRTVAKPKRKKVLHLVAKPECFTSVREKLTQGVPILDAELRAALEAAGYRQAQAPQGG
ncbi:MAG: KOW domain-containing RNA-binding protein [Oscillospiraceae bacterium]|nr:KOW domain-containing RNA-binding protein [Oscillospiraceae bacterium]